MKMSSQDEKVEYIAKPTSPNLCCSTDHLSCFTCKITQVLYAQVLLSISLPVQLVGGATHEFVHVVQCRCIRWPRRAIPFCQSQHFQSCHFLSEHFLSGFFLCISHSQTAVVICYSGKE